MKPKVILLTNYPSPYRIPLFEKIAEKTDLCVYFTMVNDNKDWDINYNYKFKHKILPCYNIKYRGKDLLNYHFNPSIFKELIKNDYDIIVVGGYTSLTAKVALLISKIRKKPFIFWSGSTLHEKSMLRTLAMPLIKLLIKNTDAFVVYGTRAREYIRSFNIMPEKIFIAINIGNAEFFIKENEKLDGQKEKLKEKLGIKNKKIVLFIGRLIPIKGVNYLIKSFEEIKKEFNDVGLVIIGNGPLKGELKSICTYLDDIHFIDFVQPEKLPIYYKIADVFVLPSIYELFSIVTSEAMASELPVITTYKNGASDDIIKNGFNGFVIKDKSPDDICAALKEIFENNEYNKMGKNSRKMIKAEFNLDKTAEGFFKAFNYVLKENFP